LGRRIVDYRGERTDGGHDPGALARAIVDANPYMTLGTADAGGRPWVSPVWFAHEDYRAFFWVSKPQARHSRNLAVRPELAIFDSTVAPGTAAALYVEGRAEMLEGPELERAIETYSRRSLESGLDTWDTTDVTGPARHRMYRAAASAHYLLESNDERLGVLL
jgi:pyridoxine/pyridoxamine 5'-phosphate oxidase